MLPLSNSHPPTSNINHQQFEQNSPGGQVIRANSAEELKEIRARIAALVRGLQTQPDNIADYAEALEVQLFLLNNVIENLKSE